MTFYLPNPIALRKVKIVYKFAFLSAIGLKEKICSSPFTCICMGTLTREKILTWKCLLPVSIDGYFLRKESGLLKEPILSRKSSPHWIRDFLQE